MQRFDLKDGVCSFIEESRRKLESFALDIFDHPELGFEELYAGKRISEILSNAGYKVENGVAGMKSAIRADLNLRADACVGLVTEYDALDLKLPDGGHKVCHACGHNLNAGAALGAALALASIKLKLGGSIVFLGTPFEEGGGGKIIMLEKGLWDYVDAALAWHGDQRDWYTVARACTSSRHFVVKFRGTRPRSISSRNYVDPNDALSIFLLALDIQDKKVSPETRIQRNVVGDVEPPNVYRLEASVNVWIRSGDDEYLSSTVDRMKDIAKGCAMAVGAEEEIIESGINYRRIVQSPVLENLVRGNIEYIGRTFTSDQPSPYPFGTDFGNISQVIPCAQLLFGIPGGFNFHTEYAVEQSKSKAALESMADGAKVMACTALDLLSNHSLIQKAKQDLEDNRAKKFKELPTWHSTKWD